MCYTITLNYTITREYSADMLICLTAPYLTDDCQLVANSGCHRLQSADVDTCIIPRTNTQLKRQELCCRRSTALEHFTSGTPSARR